MIIFLILFIFATIYLGIKYFQTKKRIKTLKENLQFQKEYNAIQKCPIEDDKDILLISKIFDELKFRIISLENEKEALEKEYQKITSDLSHDLRTPLTSILGYIELIKEDSAKNLKYLEIVEKKAGYLKELSDKFYELFLTIEKEYKVFQYIELKEFAMEKAFFNYDKFTEKNQAIEITSPDNFKIYSSKEGLEKIFVNAIDNMLKYSQGKNKIKITENPFKIEFSNLTDLTDGDYDEFFMRFKVADSSRRNSTGIGLSIVKNAAKNLGLKVNISVKDGRFFLNIIS